MGTNNGVVEADVAKPVLTLAEQLEKANYNLNLQRYLERHGRTAHNTAIFKTYMWPMRKKNPKMFFIAVVLEPAVMAQRFERAVALGGIRECWV